MRMILMRVFLPSLAFFTLPAQTLAGNCQPTPQHTTGTHYKAVTKMKVNVGEGLIVKGRILSIDGCKPIANAKIAHWQAGNNGRYQDKLYAYMFSDKNGTYQFKTEWPNLATPHIHFIVTVKGYHKLETQWIGDKKKNIIEFDMVLVPKRKKL